MSSLPLSALQALANDIGPVNAHTPREWFERARMEADKAILAERRDKKEEMFVAYVRAIGSYTNLRAHEAWNDERKRDPAWGERVKAFKEVSGVVFRGIVVLSQLCSSQFKRRWMRHIVEGIFR
jgi:ubiquitin carboxyl-terminal hydrolase 8